MGGRGTEESRRKPVSISQSSFNGGEEKRALSAVIRSPDPYLKEGGGDKGRSHILLKVFSRKGARGKKQERSGEEGK